MNASEQKLPPPRPGRLYVRSPSMMPWAKHAQHPSELAIEDIREARKKGKNLLPDHSLVSVDGALWHYASEVRRLRAEFVYDVFISCSSAEYDIAQKIWDRLRKAGIYAYFAPKHATGTNDFTEPMTEAVLASIVVLFLASTKAYEAPWVQVELNTAFNNRVPIIPFCLDAELPPRTSSHFNRYNTNTWIPTGGAWKRHYGTLQGAIAKTIGVIDPKPTLGQRLHHLVAAATERVSRSIRVTSVRAAYLIAVIVLLTAGAITLVVWNPHEIADPLVNYFKEHGRHTAPQPPSNEPSGYVLEFSRPPSCNAAYFDANGDSVRSHAFQPESISNDAHEYLQAFWNIVNGSGDAETKRLLARLGEHLDRASQLPPTTGVLRLPTPQNEDHGLSSAELLIEFGDVYGKKRFAAEVEKQKEVILVYVSREKLLAAWPTSGVGLADKAMKFFSWPKDDEAIADVTVEHFRDAVAVNQRLAWQRPLLEKKCILLCGEIPILVFNLNYPGDLSTQWQRDVQSCGTHALSGKDFKWNAASDFDSSIIAAAKDDILFKAVFQDVLRLAELEAAGAKQKTAGQVQLSQGEAAEIRRLKRACEKLGEVLNELDVDNRTLTLLPYIR